MSGAGRAGLARLGETEVVGYWVLHVDLDQFIAAVEVLRHPELRGRPVVVGGDGDPAKRGVVATASYEARAYGVQSGLPLRTALRRCPEAVFLPVDKAAYEAVSATVMAALREFGAAVEVMGWDEAFLGVETGDPEEVARRHPAARARGDQARLHGRHRREQAPGQAGDGVREAGRGVPADARHMVRGARRPANRGTVGHRPQDGREAGRARHQHGRRPGRGRPVRPCPGIRPGDRALAGPDRPRAESVAGGQRTVRGPLPRPGNHLPAGHQRLGRGARRSGAAGPSGRRLHRGRAAASGPRRGQGAVRAVHRRTHGHPLDEPTTEAVPIERAALAALDQFSGRRAVRLLGVRAEFAR